MSFPTLRLFRGRPLEITTVIRAIRDGLSVAGVLLLIMTMRIGGYGFDFYAYWAVDPADPYALTGGLGTFHYIPPMIWLAAPLKLVPWPLAYWIWFGILLLVLVWLARDWALAWLAFPPVVAELYHGNIHLLIAAAVVLSVRQPVAYLFVSLSKVTTGLIALWYLTRREWRNLAIAVGGTAIVLIVAFAIAPNQWFAWFAQISAEVNTAPNMVPIPLVIRLAVATILIVYAARTDRAWLLAPAVALSLPLLWFHGLAMLVAITPLVRASRRQEPSTMNPSAV